MGRSYCGFEWDAQRLGGISESELARRLGKFIAAVLAARNRRGIPRYAARGIDLESLPLGRVSDAAIARALGVSPHRIARERLARGIAPYQMSARHHGGVPIDLKAEPLGFVSDEELATGAA